MNASEFEKKTDEDLARMSVSREEAFYELMSRYESKLIRYVLRLIRANREIAEDVVQETFIKTYRNLNNFDPSMKFSSWMYRIAHNEAVSYWRKNQKNMEFVSIDKKGNGLENQLSHNDSAEDEVLVVEKRNKINEAIDELPEHYRDVLILRYLEEKDYEEISDILQKPMGTVAALLHRAKDRLKRVSNKYKLDELI
ncbi:sigma-70 family RNA polymerase sigma factor [Patescibacteria group bacterium]|nr:sigma-70 family RNA polymerase sigma factor [Patescibacteria group bacterium]